MTDQRSLVRRRIRVAAKVIGLSVVTLAVLAPVVSREVRFVLRAAYEEARILVKRRPIKKLVADPKTPAMRRAAFELVLDARAFAAESLGLNAKDTYTTFTDVGRDTLVLVLTASPDTALIPYLWRYPIVGAVPYKGFFNLHAARAEAQRLANRGYDTYLRPAGAFSTLGWFNDPLLSTILTRDSADLVNTVIHEIAHNSLYVRSATRFNESFAAFVGHRGAEKYFHDRGDTNNARIAAAAWHDELLLAEFYDTLSMKLERLYGGGDVASVTRGVRVGILDEMKTFLADSIGARFRVYRAEWFASRPLNNASIIAARIYRTKLDRFDAVYDQFDRNLRRTVVAIVAAVEQSPSGDPFQELEDLRSFSLQ